MKCYQKTNNTKNMLSSIFQLRTLRVNLNPIMILDLLTRGKSLVISVINLPVAEYETVQKLKK